MRVRPVRGVQAWEREFRVSADHAEWQFDRYERLLGKHALLMGEFADGAAERLVGHGERGLHVIGESGLDMPCKHHGNHLTSPYFCVKNFHAVL